MESFKNKVLEATEFVKARIPHRPQIGLQIGTGLGNSAESIDEVKTIDYKDIPHFAVSTAPTHDGRLLCGTMAGKAVIVMQGRFHYYEGYSMQQITLPVRVMQLLGVKTLIVSNAAGGINPGFDVGDIMVFTDHINLTGNNPLIGPNVDEWGPRFPDMSHVYDPNLIKLAEDAALQNNIRLQKGVYVGLAGPSLETGAEIRFLKTIGVDAVGLSTIPEVIAAVHGGMAILGFSVITNMNIPDDFKPARVEDIITAAEQTAPSLQAVIRGVLEKLPA
ncbi:MAG: purine-nucleoside phosphorylase [Deltaproteobacteria bacterium]|nr:purine-nucleoside phosphorylase [Deltaproteobacteria bacterium]